MLISQAMVFVTAAWLVLLSILGMAPLPKLPINDKALHFFGVSGISIIVELCQMGDG
jgi:hypothetical protein